MSAPPTSFQHMPAPRFASIFLRLRMALIVAAAVLLVPDTVPAVQISDFPYSYHAMRSSLYIEIRTLVPMTMEQRLAARNAKPVVPGPTVVTRSELHFVPAILRDATRLEAFAPVQALSEAAFFMRLAMPVWTGTAMGCSPLPPSP